MAHTRVLVYQIILACNDVPIGDCTTTDGRNIISLATEPTLKTAKIRKDLKRVKMYIILLNFVNLQMAKSLV